MASLARQRGLRDVNGSQSRHSDRYRSKLSFRPQPQVALRNLAPIPKDATSRGHIPLWSATGGPVGEGSL